MSVDGFNPNIKIRVKEGKMSVGGFNPNIKIRVKEGKMSVGGFNQNVLTGPSKRRQDVS
jgi:hypothetical protein